MQPERLAFAINDVTLPGAERFERPLRRRLREYFHRTRHLNFAATETRLLNQLSPSLQSEVLLLVNEAWVRRVWFLENTEEELIVTLAQTLSPMVLAPYEISPSGAGSVAQ